MDLAPNTPDEGGYWLTITELAQRKGVGKAAISERVSKLEKQSLITTRKGHGKTKLVNLAQYDKATGEVGDPAKEQGARTKEITAPAKVVSEVDQTFTLNRARQAGYEADLAKLRLDEKLAKLIPVEQVTAAMALCAEAMVRAIDQLPEQAETIASAITNDGTAGVRKVLKSVARDLRERVASAMRLLAASENDSDDQADAA